MVVMFFGDFKDFGGDRFVFDGFVGHVSSYPYRNLYKHGKVALLLSIDSHNVFIILFLSGYSKSHYSQAAMTIIPIYSDIFHN